MITTSAARFVIPALVIGAMACRDSARTPGADREKVSAASTTGLPAAPRAAIADSARSIVVNGVDLTHVGYNKGSPTAPIVIVEFSDFGCPYCGEFARKTLPGLEKEFIKTGKVFFKYVPFVMGNFRNGSEAARAAECGGDLNKFWAMYDQLFAEQADWKRQSSPNAVMARYAANAKLDMTRFTACYSREGTHNRTRIANDAAETLGVRVTPSFIVNGKPVEGALPLADFRNLLNGPAN